MELKPSEPPGHAGRKLRGLTSELKRLIAEGYTTRAIHRAVVEAGVDAGLATVQREVKRLKGASAVAESRLTETRQPVKVEPVAPTTFASGASVTGSSGTPTKRSSMLVAEEYVNKHVSNPLMRIKKGTDP